MAENTATFNLRIDANAEPAKEAAAELEKFKGAINKSKGAIEDYQKSLRMLRGSSAEVTDAKAKLKAAIDVERGKMSQANLAILKLGGSYDKLQKATKKNTTETGVSAKAFKSMGGPMRDLTEHFEGMQELLPVMATGWGALAVGIAAGVAAVALAAGAVADLTLKFTEWLATTADANRNLQLQREAFSGNAANATAWGHVMDWASERVALTTAQLQDLVVETERTYRGFRISGKGMVDAFQATSMAAGAGRKDVADFFNELLGRGKQTGRTFINYQDFARFRNAGIPVQAMYKALGITAGQAARGVMVSTDRMAAALKQVSENRFADINGKKMLSLGSQWDRLKDNLMRFTNDLAGEGGALEPLLKAIKQVADLFDLSTDSGQEMKKAVTEYGAAISTFIVAHIPDIKAFVAEVIHLTGEFIEGAAAVFRWTQSANGAMAIKAVLIAIGVVVGVLAVAFTVLAATVAAPFVILAGAIYGVMKAVDWIRGIKWGEIGTAIIDGIKSGLESAWTSLNGTVTNIGEGIKDAFKNALHIGSPSRDFRRFGHFTGQGFSLGLEDTQPVVSASATAMAQEAKGGVFGVSAQMGGGGGGGGPRIGSIENHFHIAPGVHADDVRAAVSSQSFLSQLEHSFRAILQSQGMPTAIAPSSGG